jgi:hypothetical protein
LPYTSSAATCAHDDRPPPSYFVERCACRDVGRNAVLSCVDPASMAVTNVPLYDAETQAWTEIAKKY